MIILWKGVIHKEHPFPISVDVIYGWPQRELFDGMLKQNYTKTFCFFAFIGCFFFGVKVPLAPILPLLKNLTILFIVFKKEYKGLLFVFECIFSPPSWPHRYPNVSPHSPSISPPKAIYMVLPHPLNSSITTVSQLL